MRTSGLGVHGPQAAHTIIGWEGRTRRHKALSQAGQGSDRPGGLRPPGEVQEGGSRIGKIGVWRHRASSPPLRRPGPPRPARRPPTLSPAASAASPSPTREPQAAGAGVGEAVRRGEESWARGSSCPPGFESGLTFPSLSTPAVCPEATRTPSGWTARLHGGADALRKRGGLSRPPRPPL